MDNSAVIPVPNTFVHTFETQPKLLKWQYPLIGFVAVNCDGSYRSSNGTGGYGILVRDHLGQFIMAKSNYFRKSDLLKSEVAEVEYGVIVLMIEMLAIRDGLRLAKNLDLRYVEIQSDSKIAISILLGRANCPAHCLDILFDIQREMSFFGGFRFVFIYRECNRAADFLSKFLTSDGEKCFDSSDLPHQLQTIIVEDYLGIPTARF